jgi:hypothetical protein
VCRERGVAVHIHAMRRLLFVPLVAGCDPFIGGDYVGDPLVTLTGSFAPSSEAPSRHAGGIALLWQDAEGAGGPGKAVMAVPVELSFPSGFEVAIPAPPPDSVRFAFADGTPLAECYVFVIEGEPVDHPTQFLGADRTHALIYAAGDVAPGTPAAAYLGGPVSAGYHLRTFAPVDTPSPEQAELIARCVAHGDPPDACAARRGYRLGAALDDEPLRIVLW